MGTAFLCTTPSVQRILFGKISPDSGDGEDYDDDVATMVTLASTATTTRRGQQRRWGGDGYSGGGDICFLLMLKCIPCGSHGLRALKNLYIIRYFCTVQYSTTWAGTS
jgi:hypothetical protein